MLQQSWMRLIAFLEASVFQQHVMATSRCWHGCTRSGRFSVLALNALDLMVLVCSGTYKRLASKLLEVTAPDRTDLRKRGKDNTKDAENDAHAAFANIRTVTPKSRDRMVESLSVLISCRKAQSMLVASRYR